ncbi:ATP-NAD kinase-like domain-containing protein [Poronia punctata]|nr:ATP-NAD kinase-like domain-containing protein [Poronia punctata]
MANELPPTNEIIYISKKPESESGSVYYEIISLRESDEKEGKLAFSQSKSQSVPQKLLHEYLIDGPPTHLQTSCVHVLVSTHSGTGRATGVYDDVVKPLLEVLIPGKGYNLVVTKDAESVKKFAEKELRKDGGEQQQQQHTVVLLSGDGGVVDLLNGVKDEEEGKEEEEDDEEDDGLPVIALLPLGTGNALFNSLHMTNKKNESEDGGSGSGSGSDLVKGLRTLVRGRAAKLPSFKVLFPDGSRTIAYSKEEEKGGNNDEEEEEEEEKRDAVTHLYGVVVASYGFHSQLVWESDTPAYRKHGAKRFQMVAGELLKESHEYRAKVEIVSAARSTSTGEMQVRVVGREEEGHAYVLATLVSNLEKTFCISPRSEPLDGQLRLVHFGPVGGEKTMDIMMKAYDGGKHVDDKDVGYEEDVEEVRITIDEDDARWRKVCVDGTIVEIPSGGCVVVRKEEGGRLKVLVDRSAVGP